MDSIERNNTHEEVKDFTEDFCQEDENSRIRLSKGFSIQELAAEEGIIFEPEIDDDKNIQEENIRNYFGHAAEEMEKLVLERKIDEDEQVSDDDLTEFDRARQKMEPVTEDSGVLKRVISPGLECYGTVPPGATVTIHYSMYLVGHEYDSEPFDSSVLRGRPERYKLGDGRLIGGLDVAVQTMKKTEKAQFLIDHRYAFGAMGCPPRVPGEATLLCCVELIDFVEEGVAEAILAIPVEERNRQKTYMDIEKAVRIEHGNGNNYVGKEEWHMALKHYERGIRLLQEVNLKNAEEEDRQKGLMVKLNLNKAHCCLKVHWPKKACIACKEVLDIEPENAKALYRFGRAKRMLEDYRSARNLLVRAQSKDPQSRHINLELRSLEEQIERVKKEEKMLYQNMFGGVSGDGNKEGDDENHFAETIYEELLPFKDQPEREMVLPARFSAQEIKIVKSTAASLGLEVVVNNDNDAGKKIVVKKLGK